MNHNLDAFAEDYNAPPPYWVQQLREHNCTGATPMVLSVWQLALSGN
jgi:hypothetical protein